MNVELSDSLPCCRSIIQTYVKAVRLRSKRGLQVRDAPVYPMYQPRFFVGAEFLKSGDMTLYDDEGVTRRHGILILSYGEKFIFRQDALRFNFAEWFHGCLGSVAKFPA